MPRDFLKENMHSRLCANCRQIIPIDHGFHFDDDLNLIHDFCGEIAFAVDAQGDAAIASFIANANRHSAYRTTNFIRNEYGQFAKEHK